jgi:excisionase family DNA binding protein
LTKACLEANAKKSGGLYQSPRYFHYRQFANNGVNKSLSKPEYSKSLSVPRSGPEFLTKQIAAARLKLSPRRVLELAAAGKIRQRRVIDPKTKRTQMVLLAADINRLAAGTAPAPVSAATEMRVARLNAALPPVEVTPRPWMTADQAAEYSGLPASFLLGMIASGRLAALDVGIRPGGRYRIKRTDLDGIKGATQHR